MFSILLIKSSTVLRVLQKYIGFSYCKWKSLYGVATDLLDREILVSVFKIQSCYYVHLWYPWGRYEPYRPCIILLHSMALPLKKPTNVDMPFGKESKANPIVYLFFLIIFVLITPRTLYFLMDVKNACQIITPLLTIWHMLDIFAHLANSTFPNMTTGHLKPSNPDTAWKYQYKVNK